MYSQSNTNDVETPKYIKDYVKHRWGNYFDPVPYRKGGFDPKKHKDALKIEWGMVNYINCPYTRPKFFIKKAQHLWNSEKKVSVMLLKTNNIGSAYFGKLIEGAELQFLDHHIKFSGYARQAPFSSMLVIFDGKNPGKFSFTDCSI